MPVANITRRSLLGGTFATGALTLMDGGAIAKDASRFFASIPVGLQLYTLGSEAGQDLDATLAQVAAIGYRDIELPNLYGKTPKEVRASADKAGVRISSLHLAAGAIAQGPGLSLNNAASEIADGLAALGAKRGVLPLAMFPENFHMQPGGDFAAAIGRAFAEAGEAPWKRTAALLNEKAAALKPLGIHLGYHNHNIEFAPIGRTNGWEILVKETDPRLVDFEVDVGWIATAGLDPVAFLRRHKGRVTQLHVKDVARSNVKSYAISMKPAEVGSGSLDWKRILPAARDAGVQHFYVEQEPPFTIPRMEAVRRSYAYLSALRA